MNNEKCKQCEYDRKKSDIYNGKYGSGFFIVTDEKLLIHLPDDDFYCEETEIVCCPFCGRML